MSLSARMGGASFRAVATKPCATWKDAASGSEQVSHWRGTTDPVYSVAFSPDGRRIVSGSYDKTLRLWDAPPASVGRKPMIHTKAVLECRFRSGWAVKCLRR
ncbi:MAG: hypothetical protein IPJ50_03890 [Betaproteobacteria bacterium]|nr:hypothetical protein [Betaproteobacteria bacterium]